MKVRGMGCPGKIHVLPDDPEKGTEIGTVEIGLGDGIYRGRMTGVTGRHALYFRAELGVPSEHWMRGFFADRVICEMEEFVFLK